MIAAGFMPPVWLQEEEEEEEGEESIYLRITFDAATTDNQPVEWQRTEAAENSDWKANLLIQTAIFYPYSTILWPPFTPSVMKNIEALVSAFRLCSVYRSKSNDFVCVDKVTYWILFNPAIED